MLAQQRSYRRFAAMPDPARVEQIPVERIERGRYQPRRRFDAGAAGLADSIRANGVIEPLLLRPLSVAHPPRYEIVAGERRWRAAQAAGLAAVPAIVREMSDREALEIAIVENVQRESLTIVEEARGLRRLYDEFELTHAEIAERVGKGREAVTHLIRILALPQAVLDLIDAGALSLGHAKCLLGAPASQRDELAREVCANAWTVRQLERAVRKGSGEPPPAVRRDPDVARLEDELGLELAAEVRCEHDHAAGGGVLRIYYHSLDELEGVLDHIRAGKGRRS